jgi:hypothetical protein
MASPIVAVVLICPARIAVQDCSPDTATDVTYGESASTVYECLASGQALIASTALGPRLGKDQYLKIICADPNHIPVAPKSSAEPAALYQP